jgi:hypothetical protein
MQPKQVEPSGRLRNYLPGLLPNINLVYQESLLGQESPHRKFHYQIRFLGVLGRSLLDYNCRRDLSLTWFKAWSNVCSPHPISSLRCLPVIGLNKFGGYPHEICLNVHPVERGWFPSMISDDCCLHSMMFSLRSFVDSTSHNQPSLPPHLLSLCPDFPTSSISTE